MAKTTWKQRAEDSLRRTFLLSPAWPAIHAAAKRACDYALGAIGIHGKADLRVYKYPFTPGRALDGEWIDYLITILEGEKDLPPLDMGDGEPTQGIRSDKVEGLMVEMASELEPYHVDQPGFWTVRMSTVSYRGQIQFVGWRTLASADSLANTTGQAVDAIQFLREYTSIESRFGLADMIWLRVRVDLRYVLTTSSTSRRRTGRILSRDASSTARAPRRRGRGRGKKTSRRRS